MTRKSYSGYIKFLFLFFLISLCAACAIKRKCNPIEGVNINADSLPEVIISNPVTLINNQGSNEEQLLFTVFMINDYYGNLYLWTEEAIKILSQAIELKKGKVVKNSDKVIKVAVTQVNAYENKVWGLTGEVTVLYETGNNIRKEISQYQVFGPMTEQKLDWVLDTTIEYTIMELLKDEEIINYLNN